MEKPTLTVDDRLEDWRAVREAQEWTGLLVGNGASIAVWDGFRYSSLYERATAPGASRPLSQEDMALFSTLKTTSFEAVLDSLRTAEEICRALGQDTSALRERYRSVMEALVAAVQRVHVWPSRMTDTLLSDMQAAVAPYWRVYTTNYDLLLRWAIMHEGRYVLKDYFWSGGGGYFDIAEARAYPGTRTILYLHGALNLVRQTSGTTRMLNRERGKLLDQFGAMPEDGSMPLIVTEGSVEDKLASIRRSDYLTFAYQQFAQHEGPLVVFGHRLGEADEHLVRVMRTWSERIPIAISMRRSEPRTIIARKAQLHSRLGRNNLVFFDAATHPLGAISLKVPQESRARV